MARALPIPVVLFVLVAAGCDAETPVVKTEPPPAKTPAKTAKTEPAPHPAKPEMPKFEPLTEEKARAVLHAQLDSLGGDDVSRQALLYLADLGDRSALKAVREKLLVEKDGKFEDPTAAAVGAEALLAFGGGGGDSDGGAVALRVAKQYAEEDFETDESLIRALGRVSGAERAEAIARLVKAAEGDGDLEMNEETATLAAQELARLAAPEGRDAFLRLAANKELDAGLRGAAVAGLLAIGDAKGPELAQQLVAECTNESGEVAADSVIRGFGVEGATAAVPYIKKIMDTLVAQNDPAMLEAAEMGTSITKIHARGGAADLVPWLREFDAKEGHEGDSDIARWALGDDTAEPAVAELLQHSIAAWSGPTDMGQAVEILDIAARRGVAAKPPLRPLVDIAAQVKSPDTKTQGVNTNLISLNLAAAHAFLKSRP